MRIIRERKHRLPPHQYCGPVTASFTLCVSRQERIFTDRSLFDQMEALLKQSLSASQAEAHVYLFMPDHCHLVLEGLSEAADLWKCVVRFKQTSGYWFRRNAPQIGWQKDFYDHILRRDEDIEKHVRYVLDNPIRKGIVEDWKQYPFKGSTVFDLSAW